ncbi:MAG: TIM-barrel domain-containing protein [Bryobacteraceae bacterium]
MKAALRRFCFLAGILGFASAVFAQKPPVVLNRGGATVTLEPYAPNIIRITLSLKKEWALAPPGYGFVAKPDLQGWTRESTAQADVYRSSRLVITVAKPQPYKPLPTQIDIGKYFNGSAPGAHITVRTVDGKVLTDMMGWSMSVPNHKDGNAGILYDRRPSDKPFYQVGATFVSPPGEHYYGLGQNQEGYLDHRGHTVDCWHDYNATGGESLGVPFLVTNKGYGLIWDNPSKTTIEPGFNERTKWISQVGNRVSYFVIAGRNTDEIYEGYRHLTGVTHLLPKSAYGFIQSKQRYSTQAEVMAVANGYRERHLPLDVIVIDWFYFSKMGQLDMVPSKWPDPAAMNRKLRRMGIKTMISVWPRFKSGTRYYNLLLKNGWFEHLKNGTPTNGLPYDRAGSDIDVTNPNAARWFWSVIKRNFIDKGFYGIWTDETEPDLPPNGSYFFIGPGTRYYNVYPLFETQAVYKGYRRDVKHRAVILARAAYLGAQSNGTMFWSSDIYPTWDTLRRQVPTGLDFTASGMAYWSTDIGGWQYLPHVHHPKHPPLLSPAGARSNVGGDVDYPELYTRWFEYGVFQPIFRTHGSRRHNEVWSYGKQAEPILERYLRLRYKLMPYIYSLAYQTYKTGAPYMRALFMDFPNDPHVDRLRYEYMFGPAFLVAPVTKQGATSRRVYLPKGADWYNYWTNQRFHGGQTIQVKAPIDIIPLFVRAGSIVPIGSPVESTAQVQKIAKVRVYPGANGDFTLYSDDGSTYAYEHGKHKISHLHWDDATHKLSHSGAQAWTVPDSQIVEIVGR